MPRCLRLFSEAVPASGLPDTGLDLQKEGAFVKSLNLCDEILPGKTLSVGFFCVCLCFSTMICPCVGLAMVL